MFKNILRIIVPNSSGIIWNNNSSLFQAQTNKLSKVHHPKSGNCFYSLVMSDAVRDFAEIQFKGLFAPKA